MPAEYWVGGWIRILSGETKPTTSGLNDWLMIETNTGYIFHNSGGSWNQINFGFQPLGTQGQVWTASGSGAYWADSTAISTVYMDDLQDATITAPLKYDHVEWDGLEFVNKPSNIVHEKIGMWYALTSSTTYGTGLLAEGMIISGSTFARFNSTSGQGFGLQISEGSNTLPVGLSQNNPYYSMSNNSRMAVSFSSTTINSNTRIFMGFSASGVGLSGEDPLNDAGGLAGVVAGFRVADNSDTMKVFYNDTAGSTNVADTTVQYNEGPFTLEIVLTSGTAKVYVGESLTNTITDTANLPTPTTLLYPHWELQRHGGGTKTLELYRILVGTK